MPHNTISFIHCQIYFLDVSLPKGNVIGWEIYLGRIRKFVRQSKVHEEW